MPQGATRRNQPGRLCQILSLLTGAQVAEAFVSLYPIKTGSMPKTNLERERFLHHHLGFEPGVLWPYRGYL